MRRHLHGFGVLIFARKRIVIQRQQLEPIVHR